MKIVREPYRCGRARGFRYMEIPREVEKALPGWLSTRRVDGGIEIKPQRVYRSGAWLVKLTGPSRAAKDVLRRSSAIRIADLHARLLPVRTPKPLVAIELRRGPFLDGSLLVTEFVEGPSLGIAFGRDERATNAWAPFLALLHRRGVFHGDLHPENTIWNGEDWVLIDVASLRHRLRRFRRDHLVLEQWGQLAFRLGASEALETSFRSYLAETDLGWEPRTSWVEVLRRADHIRVSRSV